jgi:hypothetical protein
MRRGRSALDKKYTGSNTRERLVAEIFSRRYRDIAPDGYVAAEYPRIASGLSGAHGK